MGKKYPHHYEETVHLKALAKNVFAFVDDHRKFSSHMGESSMMMMGSSMETHLDEKNGQEVGSHIMMEGKVMGFPIYLDEVVTDRIPPHQKTWETVGSPRLLVIGNYQMGIKVARHDSGSSLKVFIDYELPPGGTWLLGYFFGEMYARWCVKQMINGVQKEFAKNANVTIN